MKIYTCLWRATDNLRWHPQEPSSLFLRQGLQPSLELAHEGKLARQRASGIYPLPPLGQGDNSVLLRNGGHDRIGKAHRRCSTQCEGAKESPWAPFHNSHTQL